MIYYNCTSTHSTVVFSEGVLVLIIDKLSKKSIHDQIVEGVEREILEDDDFMLSTRFLELHPVTLPPTNQKKVCIEWRIMKTPSPNDSLLKNFYC